MTAPIAIATSADAVGAGWSFLGSDATGWFGEKPVQCGGKLSATGITSATLVTAIARNEINQGLFGTNSPEATSWPGHV